MFDIAGLCLLVSPAELFSPVSVFLMRQARDHLCTFLNLSGCRVLGPPRGLAPQSGFASDWWSLSVAFCETCWQSCLCQGWLSGAGLDLLGRV